MTTFNDRETAFEAKFARDADMIFKSEVLRGKLVGRWAADLLGMTGAAAEEYAVSVVVADLEKPGTEDVVAKLAADLSGKASPEQIRAKLAEMLPLAQAQLMAER